MSLDEIDRILSREEEILPSSGFVASVMEAVRREAVAPPPIPFPWKRALPCVALAGLALVIGVIEVVVTLTQLVRQASAPALSTPSPWMSALTPIVQQATQPGVAWILLALLVTLASVTFSLRLASGRA